MARYKLKTPFSELPCVPCLIAGIGVVDLSGKGYEKVTAANIHGPGKRVQVPAATQAQLKALYESGHRMIEKVEKAEKKEEQHGE